MDIIELNSLIKSNNIDKLKQLLKTGEIFIHNQIILLKRDYDSLIANIKESEYYDMLQGVKKVLLKLRLSLGI